MKRALGRLGLVLCGLVAALVLGEIILRVVERTELASARGFIERTQRKAPKSLYYWTPMGKRIMPDLDVVLVRHPVSGRDIRIRTNELGLRGAPVPPRAPGELRVLILGDSITFADHVEEEESYPVGLARDLRDLRGGRSVQVVNAGGPSLGTVDEAFWLDELAPRLEPDVVVVAFYLNDSTGQVSYPEYLDLPRWLRWSHTADWAIRRLDRWRHDTKVADRVRWVPEFLERRWVEDRGAYRRLVELAALDWGAAWREGSWPAVEAGFRHMQALARRQDFRLVIAAFPVSVQVESRVADDWPQQRLRRLTDRLGLPTVDLLPVLRAAAGSHFYDQCHLRPAAHALVARHLAEFIAALPPSGN